MVGTAGRTDEHDDGDDEENLSRGLAPQEALHVLCRDALRPEVFKLGSLKTSALGHPLDPTGKSSACPLELTGFLRGEANEKAQLGVFSHAAGSTDTPKIVLQSLFAARLWRFLFPPARPS